LIRESTCRAWVLCRRCSACWTEITSRTRTIIACYKSIGILWRRTLSTEKSCSTRRKCSC